MPVPAALNPGGNCREPGTKSARAEAKHSGGARMQRDELNEQAENNAELLRLLEQCRSVLEHAELLTRKLEETVARLANDQPGQADDMK